MSKSKIAFSCTNCSYQTAKWAGCCPGCQEWNSFTDFVPSQTVTTGKVSVARGNIAKLLSLEEIPINKQERMLSDIKEWDRVLGGGVLPGSFIILTGDPGIGKSTLLLQVANNIAAYVDVLYFSSEESLEQVKGRAQRLGVASKRLLFSDEENLES